MEPQPKFMNINYPGRYFTSWLWSVSLNITQNDLFCFNNTNTGNYKGYQING